MPSFHDKIIGHADKIKDPKVNLNDYEVIPPQVTASARIIVDMWIRLGRPTTPFTPAGSKMMNIIIAIWEDGYRKQVREWHKDRANYQKSELGLTEQVHKRTGRSLASFPLPIYNMMRTVFRGFDPAERSNCIKMVKKWPLFRMANKV